MAYRRKGKKDFGDSGCLWHPDSDNEKAPILRGNVEIGGVKYNISFWLPKDIRDTELADDVTLALRYLQQELENTPVLSGLIDEADSDRGKRSSGYSGRKGKGKGRKSYGSAKKGRNTREDDDDEW